MPLLCLALRNLSIRDGLLERRACRPFLPQLSIELRFAVSRFLAGDEAITRCTCRRVVERRLGRGQATFHVVATGREVGDCRGEIVLARRQALDVGGTDST